MAYASLFRESLLGSWLGRRRMVYFMPAIIVIASFGVYSWFDRWNRDAHKSIGFAADILEYVTGPGGESANPSAQRHVFSAFLPDVYIIQMGPGGLIIKVETDDR